MVCLLLTLVSFLATTFLGFCVDELEKLFCQGSLGRPGAQSEAVPGQRSARFKDAVVLMKSSAGVDSSH